MKKIAAVWITVSLFLFKFSCKKDTVEQNVRFSVPDSLLFNYITDKIDFQLINLQDDEFTCSAKSETGLLTLNPF